MRWLTLAALGAALWLAGCQGLSEAPWAERASPLRRGRADDARPARRPRPVTAASAPEPAPPIRGLDTIDRGLQAAYHEALSCQRRSGGTTLRAARRRAFEALQAHYRRELVASLASGRAARFRLLAQELLPYGRCELEELPGDAPSGPLGGRSAALIEALRGWVGLGGAAQQVHWVLASATPEQVIHDDRIFSALAAALAAACFRDDPDGLPAPDTALEARLRVARRRHQLAEDEVRTVPAGSARQAAAAAREAEELRDRALDAALEAWLLAEQARLADQALDALRARLPR